uniref:Uncharacterized protein n=1 Tax=Glossina austeni TaxID=7395 RepID=A0A1A9V5M0_GLOAU
MLEGYAADSVTAATAAAEAAAAATAAEDVNSKLRGKCVTTESLLATGVPALKKCEDSDNACAASNAALANHYDLNTAADNVDVNDGGGGDDDDDGDGDGDGNVVAVVVVVVVVDAVSDVVPR